MMLRLAAMLAVLASSSLVRGDAGAPGEYDIKAAFLVHFIDFARWPDGAFSSKTEPIQIGVLGEDPFGNRLEAAVQNEEPGHRPVVIRRARNAAELRHCQVVFVCRSERIDLPKILPRFSGRPVLTVGDTPGFAEYGGIINFYREGSHVRFEINRAAAQRSGIQLSSQLLSLARIVGPPLASSE